MNTVNILSTEVYTENRWSKATIGDSDGQLVCYAYYNSEKS